MASEVTAIVSVQWTIDPDGELARSIREYGVRLLAGEVDVSPQSVSNWLSGAPIPDGKLSAICSRLNVDVPGFSIRFSQDCRLDMRLSGLRGRTGMIRKRARAGMRDG